jgi:spore coat polysaccharide biosynthesis protein SpsF
MKRENVRVVGILQARTTSSRLPGKVLMDLCGAPMIVRQLERIQRARLIDRIVMATSLDASDDVLAQTVSDFGVAVYRGSLDDVLDRFVKALDQNPAEQVVRLTGDCPLTDPDIIDAVIAHHLVNAADLTSNGVDPTFPDGLDVEVIAAQALRKAGSLARRGVEREHVTQYLYARRNEFNVVDYKGVVDLSRKRWTVDHQSDFTFVKSIYQNLYHSKPGFGLWDIIKLLGEQPELESINAGIIRNEGLAKSIENETALRK